MSEDKGLGEISNEELITIYNFYAGMHRVARKCCKAIGLDEEFFEEFSDESDWVFTIKISGVFESALTHLINSSLKRPEIEENISKLNYSGRSSKIEFCKSLRIISDDRLKFLNALAQLRNHYAHGFSSINEKIVNYFDRLDANRKREWISQICAHQEIRDTVLSLEDLEERQRKLRFILFSESIVTLNEIVKKMGSK